MLSRVGVSAGGKLDVTGLLEKSRGRKLRGAQSVPHGVGRRACGHHIRTAAAGQKLEIVGVAGR